MKPHYQAVRGTHDLLPEDLDRWLFAEARAREVFGRYGFREIRTPLLEGTELFARSVGESTDIVRKEMYTFERGGESVTLRPENTAPVVRAFVEHSLHRGVAAGYPERYFYIGPMFRYERPQKGRQRQFHQIGVEVLGASEPLCDAETIEMLWRFLDALGVSDRELLLNSVGDGACRPAFRAALVTWLTPLVPRLCEDCQRRFAENPLRVFDCKVEHDVALLAGAPVMLDHLCAPCAAHFSEVRDRLEGFGVPFRVDPRMVRGLDYYQRTVFEVTARGLGAQNSILGGGRYDGLVEELGGPALPGFGFAIGLERLLLLVPDDRARSAQLDLWIVAIGDSGHAAAIALARRLRAAGLRVVMPLVPRPLGAQIKRAERGGARFALFVGEESGQGLYGLKDLASGEQVDMDEAGVIARAGDRHER